MPIDLVEFGRKIHRRRTELLLSQAEVGQNTGMPVERIEEFENGRLSPTGDEVLILADFFRCDYRFLISNERLAASEQTESLYRKYGNEFTKQDRRAILEFLYLCECEQMLKEELGHQAMEFSFVVTGTHFKGQADQAANALRAHFGYPSNAVPSDVYDDFRKIGFHLFRRRLDNSSISGITIRHPYAGTCILVNYDEDIYRQRFTAAHEGAHGIIDRGEDIVVSFVGKHRRVDLVETRANTFASRYLLPPSVITSLPITKWTQQSIVHWASHFKVSTKALAIALKEAGMVDDHAVNHLAQVSVPAVLKTDPELDKLSEHAKARKRELLAKGLSTSYVNLCFDAYAHGIISGGRIAEMMLVDNFELNEIAELFNLKMQAQ